MADRTISNLRGRNGVILAADLLFLIAYILIATRMNLGTLDIVFLVMVILSLVMVGLSAFGSLSAQSEKIIGLVQTVFAGVLSIRFLVLFFTDLNSITSLLLYGGVVLFLYVLITGILSFTRQFAAISSSGDDIDAPPGGPID